MRKATLIIVLLLAGTVSAQQFTMRNYDMHDGLSHSNVFRIFQDHRGFLWFCTNYGLCSFDGREFKTLNTDSLLHGGIISMSEDTLGNKLICNIKEGIILLSDSAMVRYPLKDYKSLKYVLYAKKRGNAIWTVSKVREKTLHRVLNNEVRELTYTDSLKREILFDKIVEYPDELLLTSSHGAYKIKDSLPEPVFGDIINSKVSDIKRGGDGTYWICLDNRLIGVKNGKLIYTYTFKPGQKPGGILCDRNNNVWVSLFSQGVFLLKDGIMEDVTGKLSINRIMINDMLQDKEGNIWIATYNAGVYKISSLEFLEYKMEDGRQQLFCHSLRPAGDNKLLIGSIGRLYTWEKGKMSRLGFTTLRPDEYVYFACRYRDRYWVGTPRGLFEKKDGQDFIREAWSGTPDPGALCILPDSKGKIWIGSYKYLYYLDAKGTMVADTSLSNLRGRRYHALCEDRQGYLWLGTTQGLFKYGGGECVQIPLPEKKEFSIINDIKEDKYGRIWVASEGGLMCLKSGELSVFTNINGLTHSKCNRLEEDDNNTMWVGTLHGLCYIDLNTLEIKEYGAGIYPDEVLSLCFAGNNVLFIGTAVGLYSIKTRRVVMSSAPPPVYITAVKTTTGQINMPAEVKLDYSNNKLRIEFIGLSYQNINTVEYRYKIGNREADWIQTSNNSVELPELPSGNYFFILSARKNRGEWSKDVFLPIHVSTPYWKTWWFVSAITILIGLTIILMTRWRIRKNELQKREHLAVINKELSLHNKITYLKQQALGALMNPHFIFNCMNSIQHYLNRNDNDRANAYLADFAHLIRVTIEDAQEAFIGLNKEITRIKLYLSLEQLRFGDHLQYELVVADDIESSRVKIPNMILQPYIENAIWHGIMPKGTGGRIRIKFEKDSDMEMKITVEDDGVGISQAGQRKVSDRGKHFGIGITHERLQLLTQLSGQNYMVNIQELYNFENKPVGTRVEINLPLKPNTNDLVDKK